MHRPHHGLRRRPLGAALVVVAVLAGAATPATAEAPAPYAAPVDGPVTDAFRPPANPYAAGNRGLDYETPPGADVRAAGPGEVTFAGQVGGRLHVVVLHPDGLRTSYSFLASVSVRRGQAVGRGEVVGTSGGALHFGARAGERYVDPALLLDGGPVEVHLVPVEDRVARPVADERRSLVRALAASTGLARSAGAAVAGWLADRTAGAAVAGARRRLAGPVLLARAVADARRGYAEHASDQRRCTPAHRPPPRPPAGRRIAVLVAGHGSSGGGPDGGHADVLDVDTAALGYDDADRVQFSYAGGRVAGVGALDGVPTTTYGPAHSTGDLDGAGRLLRTLLADIARAHPGVPVDVIAHSQGGVVARAALAGAEGTPVAHLVTLGSPHQGATLATLAGELDLSSDRSVLGDGLAAVSGGGIDPRSPAVAQLATGSDFLQDLARRPPAGGVPVTSIAASGDLVVPGLSSALADATNVLVPLGGPAAHGRLPGSTEAARELALALAGAGPTCVAATALVARVATAAAVAAVEHGGGTQAGPTVRLVDDLAAAVAGLVSVATG